MNNTNKHQNVPMLLNQEKSELEKFALFYEHTDTDQPKSRGPTPKGPA